MSVLMLPEETYKAQGMNVDPVITVYNRETEAGLAGFFRNWDEAYQQVKNIICRNG